MNTWGLGESVYGLPPNGISGQTATTPAPSVAGAAPAQQVSTKAHLLAQPSFWIVVLVGAAFGLAHMSFRFSV